MLYYAYYMSTMFVLVVQRWKQPHCINKEVVFCVALWPRTQFVWEVLVLLLYM